MADLNALLKDYFVDKRLAYNEPKTAAHEALIRGIVAEIEALKADIRDGLPQLAGEAETARKRGPGRPPKAEANG